MTQFVADLIKVLVVLGGLLAMPPVLTYCERRICAFMQDRLGPNRVGPAGLLQPIADGLKFLFKEDLTPDQVDKPLYWLAPLLAFLPGILVFAVIPFGNVLEIGSIRVRLQIADLNVGILFFLAVTSLSVYGIAFGGWASNNKYSLLGGLRSTAQLISYEVAMGLALLSILASCGSVHLGEIVAEQTKTLWGIVPAWNIFLQPLAFFIFLVSAFAENNRLPFDLPEAEPELVAGYHTEYSSMKFALFFAGEYVSMFSMSGLLVTLFLGGWHIPGMDPGDFSVAAALLSVVAFTAKTAAVVFFFIWVRWTFPRFRYDQLMRLGWRILIPLALLNLMATGILGVVRTGGA